MRPRSSATWVTIMYDFPSGWSDMITYRVILNLQGEGDQKFVPDVPESFLHVICAISPAALDLCKQCAPAICASTPSHLGYPSRIAQSSYYVGQVQITREEIDELAPLLVKAKIRPRHSRVCKDLDETGAHVVFDILQASVDRSDSPESLGTLSNGAPVTSTKGDHSLELDNINTHLRAARQVTDHPLRVEFLDYYERFFQTGDMGLFDNAQRIWMKDKQPRVETFFGFNHKYRDPAGARAEFQGFMGLLDSDGSRELNALQQDAQKYIATLPWVDGLQRQGGANGPFEMDEFQAPDFNAVYGVWPHEVDECLHCGPKGASDHIQLSRTPPPTSSLVSACLRYAVCQCPSR